MRSGESRCITVPNFVKIGQTVFEILRFFIFQANGRRYLGLFWAHLDHPRRALGDLYHNVCKICLQLMQEFQNMKVWIFRTLGLKSKQSYRHADPAHLNTCDLWPFPLFLKLTRLSAAVDYICTNFGVGLHCCRHMQQSHTIKRCFRKGAGREEGRG